MFTLAHQLVHIWLGKDGIFNLVAMMPANDDGERFCNHVAAEFLVPAERLRAKWSAAKENAKPFHSISSFFKVSPLVAARRTFDLGMISKEGFFSFYRHQQ